MGIEPTLASCLNCFFLARYCPAVYRSEAMSDTKITPNDDSQVEKNGVTRRDFIKNAAVGGAGFMIVPRHVLGRGMTPPSDLLNIAGVGIGGMGRSNLIALASQNITALCDVDWDFAGKAFAQLDNMISGLSTRIAAPDPESQPGKTAIPFDREQAKA